MHNRILDPNSLSLTLWNLEIARLDGPAPDAKAIDEALKWINKRQKDPARYGLKFAAPTEEDYRSALLPTGEKIHSRAGTAHILGEEAFWAMSKWRGPDKNGVIEGLRGMLGRAKQYRALSDKGRYCCSTCSLSLWRALSTVDIPEGEAFLERGLSTLSLYRDERCGWNSFPFAYAVYTLASLEHPLADKELKYAEGRIERALRRLRPVHDPFGLRKLGYQAALERI